MDNMYALACDLKYLLLHRYAIDVDYDCDQCIDLNAEGFYDKSKRLIVLRNPIEFDSDVFFHEATHALQHVLAYMKPLGFVPTAKGMVTFGKVRDSYKESRHAIELEAFSVGSSRTYKRLLFQLANGEILLKDLESMCYQLLR